MRIRTLLSGVSNASRPTFAVVMAVSFSWVGMGMLIGCYWFSSRVGIPRLKPPFRAKPLADFPDFCFASVECLPARMHGIGAEHQVVGMLDGRTEDEARVFRGFKFEGAIRLFEYGQLALIHDLRRSELSLVHGDPRDRVIARRFVTPFLAFLQRDLEVVDRRRRGDLARGFAVAAEDDARRALRLEMLGAQVLGAGFDIFHLGRQRDPKLKALGTRASHCAAVVPYAAARAHPFDAARLDDAFRAGCLLIGDLALEEHRNRRYAGMRMKADSRRAPRIDVEIVEEHERLDHLADVRRTDEPRDRPMRMSAGTVGNRSRHFHCAGQPMRADRAAAGRLEHWRPETRQREAPEAPRPRQHFSA